MLITNRHQIVIFNFAGKCYPGQGPAQNMGLPPPPHDHPSSIERNFSSFSVSAQPGLRYLRHASGVIVLTLGQSHALMLDPKNIVQVLWDPSSATGSSSAKAKGKKRGVDRSKLAPSGKGKKGGLPMLPETRICIVRDSDGGLLKSFWEARCLKTPPFLTEFVELIQKVTEHVIRAGIRATLLEVNDERLAQEPNLMRTAADNHGFIAILMPPMGGDWRNTNIPKQFNGMEEMRDSDRLSTEMELKECKEQL